MSGAGGTFGLGGLHKRGTWFNPVATVADLPPGPIIPGSAVFVVSPYPPTPYEWTGTAWIPFTGGGGGSPTGPAGGDLRGFYPDPTVLQSSTQFALTAVITPPSIAINTNNYAPVGLPTSSFLRLSAATPGFNLTGLTGGTDGRIITIHNVGAFPITLTDEDPFSTALNRFALPANESLAPDAAVMLQYDATTGRWRTLDGSPTASSDFDKIVTAKYTDVFSTEGIETPLVVIANNGNVVVSL